MTHGRIVSGPITREDLLGLAEEQFGDWIKAVVDVSRGVMAAGGDLHADDEALLLAGGSRQQDLWGINLYPEEQGDDWIEFDSMINIRPRDGNRSRGVDDEGTRTRICAIVDGSSWPRKAAEMPRTLHKEAATGGWASLELVEQLGNIGSEVDRAIRAHQAGRTSRFEGAFERALELFDLTADDPRWHGHRCQEILRGREEFCRLFFDPDVPPDSAEGLRKYFFGFGYAARMLHYRRQAEVEKSV